MSWTSVIVARLHALLGRNKLEREFDDEVRFHLEMQIDDNIKRGMNADLASHSSKIGNQVRNLLVTVIDGAKMDSC